LPAFRPKPTEPSAQTHRADRSGHGTRFDGRSLGLQGSGWLCTAPGVIQYLKLSGTIYAGWKSTEGSVMHFRLLEPKIFDVGQRQGFFDLYGRWRGPELVMEERGRVGSVFRSSLKVEQASVVLDWGRYSEFKTMCASGTNPPSNR
jgi:hypothetical protein